MLDIGQNFMLYHPHAPHILTDLEVKVTDIELFCLMKCLYHISHQNKKISNDQELIQSDATSCPQNQKGNN